MVEGAPLLREYTGNGIEGSNPFLSAINFLFTKEKLLLPSAVRLFFASDCEADQVAVELVKIPVRGGQMW